MPKTKEEKYSDIEWEQVRKLYRKPMQQAMRELHAALVAYEPKAKAGSPFEIDCNSYSVVISCEPEGREKFDITLELVDSIDYEGMEGGYTFRIDIVEHGGLILGGLAPFNYTDQCWCVTLEDIQARFGLIKDSLPSTVEFVSDLLAA